MSIYLLLTPLPTDYSLDFIKSKSIHFSFTSLKNKEVMSFL